MWNEKRASARVPFSVRVSYWVGQQERVEAYQVETVNISEDGVFLRSDLPLGIGTGVELEFSLPGSPEKLRVRGKVVWSGGTANKTEGTVFGKGIGFTECDDRCRSLLTRYIQEETAGESL